MEPLLELESPPNGEVINQTRARRIERPPLDESEITWLEEPAEGGAIGYYTVANGFDLDLTPGFRGRWRWSVTGIVSAQALVVPPKKPFSRALGLSAAKCQAVWKTPFVRTDGGEADNLRAAKNAALVSAYRRTPGGLTGLFVFAKILDVRGGLGYSHQRG